jgi:RimJ/RimL family protein N-acetyltransferase
MRAYKVLNKQYYTIEEYSLIPIRYEDRLKIMQWRNEQLYHLRQSEPLTTEAQDNYFATVISKLFDEERPKQILFSFLEAENCIGYGGLVHINWIDKNAEISFIMDSHLERDYFHSNWTKYLTLIEEVAFDQLKLHKIFVYAFDLRPHLYEALISNDYFKDAVLKEHCFFDNKYLDVVIYSKFNNAW